MLDALIAGKLYGQPTIRQGKSGKQFVTFKVRAATDSGDSVLVNAIGFDPEVIAALGKLSPGDSVSCACSVTPKVWIDREGITRPSMDATAHAILSAYAVSRKRESAQQQAKSSKPAQAKHKPFPANTTTTDSFTDMRSDLPWE